jgi:hypothetical protein
MGCESSLHFGIVARCDVYHVLKFEPQKTSDLAPAFTPAQRAQSSRIQWFMTLHIATLTRAQCIRVMPVAGKLYTFVYTFLPISWWTFLSTR